MSSRAASSPASLLDDARALKAQRGTPCSVRTLLETSPLAAELAEALAADVPATALAAALKRRGVNIGYDALQRHRRGACRCPAS